MNCPPVHAAVLTTSTYRVLDGDSVGVPVGVPVPEIVTVPVPVPVAVMAAVVVGVGAAYTCERGRNAARVGNFAQRHTHRGSGGPQP